MEFSCGGCKSTWTGANTSHCSACHLTFAGPSLFDKHRQATTKARVWVRYMDSEGPFPEPKIIGRFVDPRKLEKGTLEYWNAVKTYKAHIAANKANGAEIYGIETRDVQLERGKCLDPATLTRPLSDREIELGAVGFEYDAEGCPVKSVAGNQGMVPVFEFYGTTYEAVRDGKTQVRTRAEMWRSYRLRNAEGEIIDLGTW